MKDKLLISIIVPVYNAEKYLSACIESILQQTYHDFELLLIDDGSNDRSASICDEYALRDSRVKVFHKSNGGVSSARNHGIQEARGEWITFIDSDDFVDSGFLKNFYDYVTDEDVYICNACKFLDEKQGLFYKLQSGSIDTTSFLRKYGLLILDTPWAKFFKKSILTTNNLKFDERFQLGEDTLFNMHYIRYCDKVCINEKPYYYYRMSENNLSRCLYSYNEEFFLKKQVKKEYEEIVKAKGRFVDNINIARLFATIYRSNDYPKEERVKKLKEIKEEFPNQINNLFQLTFGYGGILRMLLSCRLFSLFDFFYRKILQIKYRVSSY